VWILPDITGDLFVRLFISNVVDGKDNGSIDSCLFRLLQHPLRVVVGCPGVAGRVTLAVVHTFTRMAVGIDHAAGALRWAGLLGRRRISECEGAPNQQATSDKIAPIHGPSF